MKIQLASRLPLHRHLSWPIAINIAVFIVTCLFFWKGIGGLLNYTEAELGFRRQRVFGDWAPFLAITNIILQLSVGVLLTVGLFNRKSQLFGLLLSTGMLAVYTVYTQLVLLRAFGLDICTCIGWFAGMSWTAIFIMNICLLLLSIILLFITLKERRLTKKSPIGPKTLVDVG